MKSLYIGMAVIALVLIILSITIETSFNTNIKLLNRNNNNNRNNRNNNNNRNGSPTSHSLRGNKLDDNKPSRIYGENNLNKIFLGKYYNNNYPEDVEISNKFYVPN